MRLRWTLQTRIGALLAAAMAGAAAAGLVLQRYGAGRGAAIEYIVLALAILVAAAGGAHRALRPLRALLRALAGAVASYRDGDFGFSLRVHHDDELGALLSAHNELGRALREQRLHLVQRELLLDTVTQNSPVALVLVDAFRNVVYANLAARALLGAGRSPIGLDFDALLSRGPEGLRAAASGGGDTLFSVDIDGEEETFHLSQRGFLLRGVPHRLYLLKRLTRELSRQEVATWKKLIRILSHELNNSLAPIASLAQSGGELVRRHETEGLIRAFAAIGERAESLHRFISAYATFAKLPAPRIQAVPWHTLYEEVAREQPCRLARPLPPEPGWFDRSQLVQALLNLLKNAHEAGGSDAEVELAVAQWPGMQQIEVRDRGPGMTATVLSQALLPFYSTKRQGTGLGLALAREIAEGHGGRIVLANREGGGLVVTLTLPVGERRADARTMQASQLPL